LANHTSS